MAQTIGLSDGFQGIVRRVIAMTGPGVALQELLYGFIMALIFVYAARLEIVFFDTWMHFAVVEIGMIATWGTIDGIVFYFIALCNRRRYGRIISNADGEDDELRTALLMDEFSSTPLDVLPDKEKEAICRSILDKELQSAAESRSDDRTMLQCSVGCLLISLSTLVPILIPVIVIEDFMLGLEVASVLSSVVLFFIGYFMSSYLGSNRWLTGLTLMGMSLVISLISTYTGG